MNPPSPYSIHFVHDRLDAWADVLGADVPSSPDELAHRLIDGRDSWIIQAYIVLRRRGWDVTLSARATPGRICVMHAVTFEQLPRCHDAFLVVARGDRGPVLLADHLIVQNQRLAVGPRTSWLPVWPQPGLLPRDGARGDRVERVAYFGYLHELSPRFCDSTFRARLESLGVELVTREARWWDYSDVDAVLAVRDRHPAVLLTKPASKLTNAWQAGCPALLAPEPAFADLRRSELDYLEVRSPDEALSLLEHLRSDPDLYRRMVENGRRRGEDFSLAATTRRWESVLRGSIAPAYERWLRRRGVTRALSRARRRALEPVQTFARDRYALRVDNLSPRGAIYRSRGRPARVLAAAHLIVDEGLTPLARRLVRRWRPRPGNP